jgi:hypothetical protein
MAITSNYTLLSFDSVTAQLAVEAEVYNNSTLILNRIIFITLPVDSSGNVPTGTTLSDLIDKKVNYRLQGWIAYTNNQNNIPIGGITNADDITSLTTDTEYGTDPQYGIPVLVFPISGNTGFTQSVIMPMATFVSRLNFTPADPSQPANTGPNSYLDNGNVYGGQLVSVQGDTNLGNFNTVNISSTPPNLTQPIIDAFPYVFDWYDEFPDRSGGDFNTVTGAYLVNHEPMTISATSYGIGWFIYS